MPVSTQQYEKDSLAEMHPSVGGSAGDPDLTHGGQDVSRPPNMPRQKECTHTVSTTDELVDAVQDDDATIWLDEQAVEILFKGPQNVWFGEGVEIVGQYCDPAYPGMGTRIKQDYYHRNLFLSAYGNAPKLWGVPLIGPMLGDSFFDMGTDLSFEDVYFDPRTPERTNNGQLEPSDWYASGLHCYDRDELYVHGCLFAGWSLAGLEIGAKGYQTPAEIQRSSFVLNAMETLGYGIESYNGHQWLNRCYFDGNRHAVSAFGYPTQSYEVTECASGKETVAGHVLDMHELNAENNVGGHHVYIRNCSNLTLHDINGYKQEFYVQRGVPELGDEIWNCATVHPGPQPEPGDQGDFVRQEDPEERDEWEHFSAHDNYFGDALIESHGTPLADQGLPGNRYLVIYGQGPRADYRFRVKGRAAQAKRADKGDITDGLNGDRCQITGTVWGGVDAFQLHPDAEIEGGLFNGPVTIKENGTEIDKTTLLGKWLWN